ncbi:uncharacterized protein JCM6883_003287, partial [Sporobolomyces salmoneus]|uniref:uncharacterized protein n=1 Tax=Sporobolomyces salmoneus TaxID=183962 RepID=UPI00317D93E7
MSEGAPSAPSSWGQPQETSPLSSSSSTPLSSRHTPTSSLYQTAKGIATTAIHVAQLAIEGEDHTKFGFGGQGQLGGMIGAPQQDPWSNLKEMLTSHTYVKDAIAAANVAVAHESAGMDDRKMLLESVIVLLYSLPPDSKIGDTLENAFIRLLWNNLQHPPISYVGKSKYRSADGSGNNFFNTRLGAAGE